jgi:hypothetical protein
MRAGWAVAVTRTGQLPLRPPTPMLLRLMRLARPTSRSDRKGAGDQRGKGGGAAIILEKIESESISDKLYLLTMGTVSQASKAIRGPRSDRGRRGGESLQGGRGWLKISSCGDCSTPNHHGDLRETRRRWYARQRKEHDGVMRRLAENLHRRGVCQGL